jgi:uncharacterized membrane protein YkoI
MLVDSVFHDLFKRDTEDAGMPEHLRPYILAVLLGLVANGNAAQAGDEDDHERAHEAMRRGELLALDDILAMHMRLGDRLLDVELDRKGRRWEYEIELLGSDGRVRELEIDGASGRLLDIDVDDYDEDD